MEGVPTGTLEYPADVCDFLLPLPGGEKSCDHHVTIMHPLVGYLSSV